MSKLNKRDATPEESDLMLAYYLSIRPDVDYKGERDKCRKEGLKCEVCDCGAAMPAFVHFVRCQREGCPFRGDGESLLERILGISKEK